MIKEISDFSIEAIAESGQCFRITRVKKSSESKENMVAGSSAVPALRDYAADSNNIEAKTLTATKEDSLSGDIWRIIAYGRVLELQSLSGNRYKFSCSETEFDSFWRAYFDLAQDYGVYRAEALPDDEYLQRAIRFGRGIRILNQEPWEMLISFIISQRKSVPAIRTSVERLSERFGERIDGTNLYAFPNPLALAKADTKELAECGLGYRVPYVRDAAELVAGGSLELDVLNELDTDKLIEALMELKGVGIKVASCVALFGYHRLDVLPVDVWMQRVIETVYNGSLPDVYKPYAGVLQQYMFNYARLNNLGT